MLVFVFAWNVESNQDGKHDRHLLPVDLALSLPLFRFYVQTKWHTVGATDQGLVLAVNV